MRYIKSYNESKSFFTYSNLMLEMKDILLPISDLGYDVGVEMSKDIDTNRIYIRIVRYGDPTLVWNKEIEEEFNRLREFSLENGFKLSKVYYITEEPDGRVISGNSPIISYDNFLEVIGEKIIVNLLFELEQISR
jgi:hypothetical protein